MSKNTIDWRSLLAAASVIALAACVPARPVQQSDAYTPSESYQPSNTAYDSYGPSDSYQPGNTAYPVSNGYPATTTTTVYAPAPTTVYAPAPTTMYAPASTTVYAPAPATVYAPAPTTVYATTPAPLIVNQSQVGYVIATPQGQTVYTYDRDVPGRSTCYGDCVTYWRPVYAPPGAVSTGYYTLINREDGRTQWATSGGMPLYTYTYDRAPGDITGNNYQSTWHAAYVSNSNMRIVTNDAPVAIQPNANARVVTVLNTGTRVAVLDNSAGWTHVQAPGVDGYIPAGSLH